MKSKNGKYNMKGGNKYDEFIGLLSNLPTEIINSLNNFGVKNLPGIILFFICLFALIYIVSIFLTSLNTCTWVASGLVLLAIAIYIVDILGVIDIRILKNILSKEIVEQADKTQKSIDNFVLNFAEATQISSFYKFINNINHIGIVIIILITAGYIASICFSAMSFSSGRDIDMKPFSILKTIFIYIISIISIIFMNFAIGREIAYETIGHFIIKVLMYILLILIAISCTDDDIFKTSNILNLICSSIMLIIIIIIVLYIVVEKFIIKFQPFVRKMLNKLGLNNRNNLVRNV